MADFQWLEINASQTLEHWKGYIVDSRNSDMDLILPPNPSDGTYLRFADGYGSWGDYPVRLDAGNNVTYNGDRYLELDTPHDDLGVLFKNGRWVKVK